MSRKKTTVGILFGGMSAEHEVSIESAKAILSNIDRDVFSAVLIYITKQGQWCRIPDEDLLKARPYSESLHFQEQVKSRHNLYSFIPWENSQDTAVDCDIFFPILHGPNGEDGKIQSLLEMARKPFVGANSVSSALAMNKSVAKILFVRSGLMTPPFLYFDTRDIRTIRDQVKQNLTYPVFVKPNSLGSSIGISRIENENQLEQAIHKAFRYDRLIIIEQAIEGRELEISVMGNREIMVSDPGELVPHNEFYDYNDKYIDNKTIFKIPAPLETPVIQKIKIMAEKAYQALWLNGMSRIDFFLEAGTEEIYINEINTIPGFTEISMFPKLWQLQGISFTHLISRLIEYGFSYQREGEKPPAE